MGAGKMKLVFVIGYGEVREGATLNPYISNKKNKQ